MALTNTPSNDEVKERVELYHYSPSGTSWPDLACSLPLPYSDQSVVGLTDCAGVGSEVVVCEGWSYS